MGLIVEEPRVVSSVVTVCFVVAVSVVVGVSSEEVPVLGDSEGNVGALVMISTVVDGSTVDDSFIVCSVIVVSFSVENVCSEEMSSVVVSVGNVGNVEAIVVVGSTVVESAAVVDVVDTESFVVPAWVVVGEGSCEDISVVAESVDNVVGLVVSSSVVETSITVLDSVVTHSSVVKVDDEVDIASSAVVDSIDRVVEGSSVVDFLVVVGSELPAVEPLVGASVIAVVDSVPSEDQTIVEEGHVVVVDDSVDPEVDE